MLKYILGTLSLFLLGAALNAAPMDDIEKCMDNIKKHMNAGNRKTALFYANRGVVIARKHSDKDVADSFSNSFYVIKSLLHRCLNQDVSAQQALDLPIYWMEQRYGDGSTAGLKKLRRNMHSIPRNLSYQDVMRLVDLVFWQPIKLSIQANSGKGGGQTSVSSRQRICTTHGISYDLLLGCPKCRAPKFGLP